MTVIRSLASPRRLLAAGVLGLVALGTFIGLQSNTAKGFPIPSPVYEIEARSGNHTASLLNLPLGQPGVLQAPIPVDVDGDLLPDVLVTVGLANTAGLLQNPPNLNDTLAPNIVIDRNLVNLVLGRPSPPLRINVKLTIKDSEGGPDMYVRAGYDTGHGGSIPMTWRAALFGLNDFFNPMEVVVDTKGNLLYTEGAAIWYEGPLTIVAGLEQGSSKLAADLEYKTFPDSIRARILTDDAGLHLGYRHGTGSEVHLRYGSDVLGSPPKYVAAEHPEVDLVTRVDMRNGADTTKINARVDRLPRQIDVDFLTSDDGSGRVDYHAKADGRKPDVSLQMRSVTDGQINNINATVEGLPPEIHALWELPDEGPMSARITTIDPDDEDAVPDDGINVGAVELAIRNFDGSPTLLTPFQPTELQYFSFQSRDQGSTEERMIDGRIERIRDVTFQEAENGMDASADIGDGVSPLEVNLDTDALPEGDLLKAHARLAPLPHHIDVSLRNGSEDDIDDPMTLDFESSEAINIDGRVELRKASAAGDDCGQPKTICADLRIRHLPEELHVRFAQEGEGPGAETRVELDAARGEGQVRPDVFIDAVLGKDDGIADPDVADDDPTVLALDAGLLGLPDHVRLRQVEGEDENIKTLDLETCVVTDLVTGACEPGTRQPLEEAHFKVANFLPSKRPADLPQPVATAPNNATVAARGLDTTTDTIRFEAAGRIFDIEEVRLYQVDGLLGVRTDLGGGRDLEIAADLKNIEFDDNPDQGRVDIQGQALVTPLPKTLDLCFREPNQDLGVASGLPFTQRCESTDPFGDGSTASTPLTFSYKASSNFSARGSFETTQHRGAGTDDDHATAARFELTNIPKEMTAHVDSAPEGVVGPTRVLALAPGASNFDGELSFEDRFGGADCDDPRPAHDIQCIQAKVDDIPPSLSALANPAAGEATAEVHACNFDFNDAQAPAGINCVDTITPIGSVEATFRNRTVSPSFSPPPPAGFLPLPPQTTKDQFVVFQMDNKEDASGDDASELFARARIEKVRHITFNQLADGFDAFTDLGDNVKPLEAHIYIDTRPAVGGAQIIASSLIDPLPQTIHITQTGPGEDQAIDPLELTYDTSAIVDVTASAEIRKTGSGATCGTHDTICADVFINDLPKNLEVELGKSSTAVGIDGTRLSTTDLSIDLNRFLATDPKADITLDAVIGSEEDIPLIAHAGLTDLPDHMRLNLEARERLGGVDAEVVDSTIENLRFQACDDNDCSSPDEKLSGLDVSVRNFFLRPRDFPPPPVFPASVPNHAAIVQRAMPGPTASPAFLATPEGDFLEASVVMSDIREVQYYNRGGLTGARARIGGNANFAARVDIDGLSMGEETKLGDLQVFDPIATIKANVELTPLPGEIDFCIRAGGISPVPASTGLAFTALCEASDPFQDGTTFGHTPLSVAYDANTDFGLAITDADFIINGIDANDQPIPQHRVKGSVSAPNMPADLTVHVLQPRKVEVAQSGGGTILEQQGPFRAQVRSSSTVGNGDGIDLTFNVEQLTGNDVVCKDFRYTVEAFCLKGTLENLPTRADIFYDPDDPDGKNNLSVTTQGTGVTNLVGLDLSTVRPTLDADNNPVPGEHDVLTVTGAISGIPKPLTIVGDLDLPKPDDPDHPAAIRVRALNNKIVDTIDIHVRNFLVPDPTAGITMRPRDVGDDPDQTIEFIQRGDAFRLDALIKSVKEVAYRSVSNTVGEDMGTKVVGINFGGNDQNIRAFADLQPDQNTHVVIDALLEDVPNGLTACFRSAYPVTLTNTTSADAVPTHCDSGAVPNEQGAFEFRGLSASGNPGMDVDAFVRMTGGGGSSVLAARANIENIPPVVQGMFPANGTGFLEIASFNALPDGGDADDLPEVGNAEGIDQIEFNAASFDLQPADTGYQDGPDLNGDIDLPYSNPRYVVKAVASGSGNIRFLPAKADPGGQYLHAGTAGPHFNARGRIGLPTTPTQDSELKKLRMGSTFCPKPTDAGARPDYPEFPADGGFSKYTCIRADFETDPGDRLGIDMATLGGDGKALLLHDAGLTDIPAWFQATLATTPPYVDDPLDAEDQKSQTFRAPCGVENADGTTSDTDSPNCMPPMIRLDSADNSPRFFAVFETGRPIDLGKINNYPVAPGIQLASSTALPETGWAPDWGTDPLGVRLKLVSFGGATKENKDDDFSAVRANIRIALPESLTMDQLQTYSDDDLVEGLVNGKPEKIGGKKASDLRVRFAVRDRHGAAVTTFGELSAQIEDADKKEQVLVSRPCNKKLEDSTSTGRSLTCAEYLRGLVLPGEIGLQMFTREGVRELVVDDKDHYRNESLQQIDVRVSHPLSAGIRILKSTGPQVGEDGGIGLLELALVDAPAYEAGDSTLGPNPLRPTARVRAEIIKDVNREGPAPGVDLIEETPTVAQVNTLYTHIDMTPGAAADAAHHLDAAIYMRSARIAADLVGYSAVGGPALSGATRKPVDVAGVIDIDPLAIDLKLHWTFALDAGAAVNEWADETFDSDIIGDILGFIVEAALAPFQALLNAFPIEINMDTGLLLQFNLDDVKAFTLRDNTIHLFASNDGGTATIGPVNIGMRTFEAGLIFDGPEITIPDWVCWVPGIPCSIDIDIPLLEILYLDIPPHEIFQTNSLLRFISCDNFFTQLVAGFIPPGLQGNSYTVGPGADDDEFLMYPLADPRYQLTGVLVGLWGGLILDTIIDLIAGPIFCNVGFDVDANMYEAIDYNLGDVDEYNPGLRYAKTDGQGFSGHPVPGQPNQPTFLPNTTPAAGDPPTPPEPFTPPPPEPTPPPPGAPPAEFSGLTHTQSTNVSLCGSHTFAALTINAVITVTNTPNTTDWVDGVDMCPAGQGGTLTLKANSLVVEANGQILADDLVSADPFPDGGPGGFFPLNEGFATGNSGGGHDGADGTDGRSGGDGTEPRGGFPYADRNESFFTETGSSGAGVAAGNDGGGAITLVGDTLVKIKHGAIIRANGDNGAANTAGTCDNDPDDNNIAGHQTFLFDPDNPDNPDGDEFHVPNPVRDGPGWGARPNAVSANPPGMVDFGGPFENPGTGPASGGGSGGGIVLAANRTVEIEGTPTIQAHGGLGGASKVSVGGGGGGGLFKVLAPFQVGVSSIADVAGGGTDNSQLCAGVTATGVGFIPQNIAQAEAGESGTPVLHKIPGSELLQLPRFWYPGVSPAPAIHGHFVAAAADGTTNGMTVAVCGLHLPTSAGPPLPASLGPLFNALADTDSDPNTAPVKTQPTSGAPCGAFGSSNGMLLGTKFLLQNEVQPPGSDYLIDFTPPAGVNRYLGLYTTVARSTVANNNCLNPADAGGANDATACVWERMPAGVDQIIGVDATRPTVSIASPADGHIDTVDFITLDANGGDQPNLSKFKYAECRSFNISSPPAGAGDDWVPCGLGTINPLTDQATGGAHGFQLEGGAGTNVIQVRAFDKAGNVSQPFTNNTCTPVVAGCVKVTLDFAAPTATAKIAPPNGQNGWYVGTAPTITIGGYQDDATAPNDVPFTWHVDAGGEFDCPSSTNPPNTVTCTVPLSDLDPLATGAQPLQTGTHSFHYTARDRATPPNRLYDDVNDPFTPGPMHTELTFNPVPGSPPLTTDEIKYDPEDPQVVISSSPANATHTIGADGWFNTRPFLVFSAIDQVGGSGLKLNPNDFDRIEYSLDGGANYTDYDPTVELRLANGVTNVCVRATDVAGNDDTECRLFRVDDRSPDHSQATSPAAPDGANGWYVTAPTVSLGGYSDHGTATVDVAGPPTFFQPAGLFGARFRYRLDNAGFQLCGVGCNTGPLGTGIHWVHSTAVDRLDNRSFDPATKISELTSQYKVDLDDPVTKMVLHPAAGNGANDWFLKGPWISLDATDEGSGVAEVRYDLDDGTGEHVYTGPVRLTDPGDNNVCWYAIDVAGRTEAENCASVKVDLADPSVALQTAPLAPNGGNGWFLQVTPIAPLATDPVPGSGVDQAFDSVADLCSHLPKEPNPQPSGICISVDGAAFVPYGGAPLQIGEGIHTVRTFTVDVSGRRSTMTTQTVKVDLSAPLSTLRTFPPAPATPPFVGASGQRFRHAPTVHLRANDGYHNAGVTRIESRLGAVGPFGTYAGSFVLATNGPTTVFHRGVDAAGRTEIDRSAPLYVDTVSPVARALAPNPSIWVRILGLNLLPKMTPPFATLNWSITENVSGKVQVYVLIYDALGNAARRLDGGVHNVTAGVNYFGATLWDGKDESLLNFVPVGLYRYRVVAIDEAGNRTQSGESMPLQIKISLL